MSDVKCVIQPESPEKLDAKYGVVDTIYINTKKKAVVSQREPVDLKARTFTERFDTNKAMALISNPSLISDKTDEVADGIIKELKKYVEKSENGLVKIKYKYGKNRNSGRIYGSGMQPLPHRVRHTIAGEFDHDIDIINCHPDILSQECDKIGIHCSKLKEYINNRDSVLADVIMKYRVTRDQAKNLFIRMLNVGSFKAWCVENAVKGKPNNFISEFEKELTLIQDAFWNKYPQRHRTFKSSDNPRRTLLSFIIQEIENDILSEIVRFEEQRGRTVTVLIFDGCQIRKDPTKPLLQTELDQCSEFVKQETGYKIRLIEKPMTEPYVIPDIANENNTVKIAHHLMFKNETDAAMKLIEIHGKELIKYCEGSLYVYDRSTGLWNNDEISIRNTIQKSYTFELADWVQVNKEWDKLYKAIKSLCLDPKFLKRMELTGMGKILFQDGYWDFESNEFCKTFNPKYYFPFRIERCFNPNPSAEHIAHVNKVLFDDSYSDKETGTFMKQKLSRSVAGTGMRDKSCIIMIGEPDSGKGVLIDACIAAIESYAGTFNSEVLVNQKTNGDPSLRYKEFLSKASCRLLFSSETDKDSSIDGTLVQKLTSGGDTLTGRHLHANNVEFIPQFVVFLLANDKPKIVPFNDTDTGRVFSINFPYQFTTKPIPENSVVFKKADPTIKDQIRETWFKDALFYILTQNYIPHKPIANESVALSSAEWSSEDNFDLWFERTYEITKNLNHLIDTKSIVANSKDNGFSISSIKVGLKLQKLPGITKIKRKTGYIYAGIVLRTVLLIEPEIENNATIKMKVL